MADFRCALETALRNNWKPILPTKEAAFCLLLDILIRIAKTLESGRVSSVSFQGLNIPATRLELRKVMAGAHIAAMHETTRVAAAKVGISSGTSGDLPMDIRNRRLRSAIKNLILTPNTKRPDGSDGRGPKLNTLARIIALILIAAYRDITGENPEISGRSRGLAPSARGSI